MITESFDDKSPAKRDPVVCEKNVKCDVCLVTFSYLIKEYILNNFDCKQVGTYSIVTGIEPIYTFKYKTKIIGFYQTPLGASASAIALENVIKVLDCNKFIFFGAAGCLKKEIAHGKVMVPTYSYRDEGTSYHYAKAKDYIKIKNSSTIASFMKENNIPYLKGRNWTTDALYRETQNNIEKRRAEGCISVDMECSAIQAVCDFRNIELYYFFVGGDLLDAPKWLDRSSISGVFSNHSLEKLHIALKMTEIL